MEEVVASVKLERLKLPSSGTDTSHERFFHTISEETGTKVVFEPGCKNFQLRKESCVRITGSVENVKKAKELLLDRTEIQNDRVLMKLDVAHSEHPSLIGRKGALIKRVMTATRCHIHFPDGNKGPVPEKNNQVSIYGDSVGVERARVLIRALIPIQIYFELPSTSPFRSVLTPLAPTDGWCPLARHRRLLLLVGPGPSLAVRCGRDQFGARREDIDAIVRLFCGTRLAEPVHATVDVMQQHRACVRTGAGPIAERTGARVGFTAAGDVRISGNLDSVYAAWREIMNILPITVSFDVNETREIKGDYTDFLRNCGVRVYSCPKPKYYIQNVSVKGPEKFSKPMLRYREHLLRTSVPLTFAPDSDDEALAAIFLSQQASGAPSEDTPLLDVFLRLPIPGEDLSTCYSGHRWKFTHGNVGSVAPLFTNNNWMEKGLTDDGSSESSVSETTTSPVVRDSSVSFGDCDVPSAEDYYRKKLLAAKAMRRPIESAQVPSSAWAGCGFSRSMPAVRRDPIPPPMPLPALGSRSSSEDSDGWENCTLDEIDLSSKSGIETRFSHSNYFDFPRPVPPECPLLAEVLWRHGMHKYADVFARQEVDFRTFLMLTEEDLHSLSVTRPAATKMLRLIRELKNAEVPPC